jgi:hypothetical protein
MEPWFNPTVYAFVPGVVIGVVGGTLGTLAGILAPRGRGRGLVLGLWIVMIVVSIGLLAAGVVALATGQPYGVWYGLGLAGLIGSVVLGSLFFVVRQRYREAEMRQMRAADLR